MAAMTNAARDSLLPSGLFGSGQCGEGTRFWFGLGNHPTGFILGEESWTSSLVSFVALGLEGFGVGAGFADALGGACLSA